MSSVDEQMNRLYLSRWLTRRVGEAIGATIHAGATQQSLEKLAAGLRNLVDDDTPLAGLEFDPPYPGLAEPTEAVAGSRLVLTCSARLVDVPLGVVYTVLIPGRLPEVSVAPPNAKAHRR